jgi:hypothetical protein
MFFIRCLGEPQESASETEVVAHLTFEGDPSGSLTLSVAAGVARSVAADFLGEEEPGLSEQQIGDVVCELANMICGSVLSRVESTTTFRLASPRIMASGTYVEGLAAEAWEPGSPPRSIGNPSSSTIHAVETRNGAMVVTINTEIPACSTTERYGF